MPTFGEIQNMRVGIWNYTSGTSGTVDMSTLYNNSDITGLDECRVLSITCIAGTSNATVKIDNRDNITVPANQSLTLTPNGTIVNPTIIFTGTASYVIEFVTNNFHGSTRGNI